MTDNSLHARLAALRRKHSAEQLARKRREQERAQAAARRTKPALLSPQPGRAIAGTSFVNVNVDGGGMGHGVSGVQVRGIGGGCSGEPGAGGLRSVRVDGIQGDSGRRLRPESESVVELRPTSRPEKVDKEEATEPVPMLESGAQALPPSGGETEVGESLESDIATLPSAILASSFTLFPSKDLHQVPLSQPSPPTNTNTQQAASQPETELESDVTTITLSQDSKEKTIKVEQEQQDDKSFVLESKIDADEYEENTDPEDPLDLDLEFPSIPTSTINPNLQVEENEENEDLLISRFKSIFSGRYVAGIDTNNKLTKDTSATVPEVGYKDMDIELDSQDLHELMESLLSTDGGDNSLGFLQEELKDGESSGGNAGWNIPNFIELSKGEDEEIEKLLAEARVYIETPEGDSGGVSGGGGTKGEIDASCFKDEGDESQGHNRATAGKGLDGDDKNKDDSSGGEEENENLDKDNEDDSASAIIRRIKDELEVESKNPALDTTSSPPEDEANDDDEDNSDELTRRLTALSLWSSLPSAPTTTATPKSPSSSLPDFPQLPGLPRTSSSTTDNDFHRLRAEEEADHWCSVCNDDAEYKCSGCDGDLYCGPCLHESHTGPNAGYEERRHKWTMYTKPGQRRRLIGAS